IRYEDLRAECLATRIAELRKRWPGGWGFAPLDSRVDGHRLLHVAAYSDSPRVAALLIERGAAIDVRESNFGATPLGFAMYAQESRMIELLSRVSREVFNLT